MAFDKSPVELPSGDFETTPFRSFLLRTVFFFSFASILFFSLFASPRRPYVCERREHRSICSRRKPILFTLSSLYSEFRLGFAALIVCFADPQIHRSRRLAFINPHLRTISSRRAQTRQRDTVQQNETSRKKNLRHCTRQLRFPRRTPRADRARLARRLRFCLPCLLPSALRISPARRANHVSWIRKREKEPLVEATTEVLSPFLASSPDRRGRLPHADDRAERILSPRRVIHALAHTSTPPQM